MYKNMKEGSLEFDALHLKSVLFTLNKYLQHLHRKGKWSKNLYKEFYFSQ